jgi:hypothetical protein
MTHERNKYLNLLTTTALFWALASACGGTSDNSGRGGPSGQRVEDGDPEDPSSNEPTGSSPDTASPTDMSEGTQCLERSCRPQLEACGASCLSLSACLADCTTEACARSCGNAAGSVAVDQLLAIYDCSDAHCGTGEPAPEPEPACEDVADRLPGTVWAGFLCADGRVGSACPEGADRTLFAFKFDRNGTYQVEMFNQEGGQTTSTGGAGRWRTSCGGLSTTTCRGDDPKNYAAQLSGNLLRLANLELDRWDEGLDVVPFSLICR